MGEPIQVNETQSSDLVRIVEALLHLAPEPLELEELVDACEAGRGDVEAALAAIEDSYAEGKRGIVLRKLAGGYTFASDPVAEEAAKRLFARRRAPTLSQAQLECLAIAAYVGPVSRPEIARIRGVSSESAVASLVERGLLIEAGRSRFGAIRYKTAPLFEKLFGLGSRAALPEIAGFDATPEDEQKLRERLLKAGEAR